MTAPQCPSWCTGHDAPGTTNGVHASVLHRVAAGHVSVMQLDLPEGPQRLLYVDSTSSAAGPVRIDLGQADRMAGLLVALGHLELATLVRDVADDAQRKGRQEMSAVKHRAPIKRLHADGTQCAHRIAPTGRAREGQDCPGVASYAAACPCGWAAGASIRAIVEEWARGHRASAPVTAEGEVTR
jgi:hypothetical protein